MGNWLLLLAMTTLTPQAAEMLKVPPSEQPILRHIQADVSAQRLKKTLLNLSALVQDILCLRLNLRNMA